MKTRTTKTIAIALCMALLAALMCTTVFAAENTTVATNDLGESFDSLENAVNETYENYGEGKITLLSNDALQNDLIIPDTIEVIIPTSATAKDTYTGGANVGGSNPGVGTPYVTLTVPSGVELTVNGTLLVAGNQEGAWPQSGYLAGNYGAVTLNGTMTVNGTLYARGAITGSGEITVSENGTVYQRFEMADWRGGTGASHAYDDHHVFPFSLYSLAGIDVKTTYEHGARLYGQSFVYVLAFNLPVTIPYISDETEKSGYLVNSSSTGEIIFTKNNGITTITLNNAVLDTGNLKFEALGESFDSDGYICPFGYRTNVVLDNNSTLNVKTELKIIPGCNITVNSGSTLDITSTGAMYFFTGAAYKSNFNWANWSTTANATLTNHGTVTVTGELGSSDENLTNIPGFTATGGTYLMTEYIQSSNTTGTVTFYLAK